MIPWTVAHQAPLSMEFSRPEYWSDLPFPFQGIFLTQGSNPGLLYYRQILSLSEPQGKPLPGGATPNFVPERFLSIPWGFPGGSNGKESACNAGDTGSIPGSGRSPGEANGFPLQYSCLENFVGRGAWWATVQGAAKSWTRLSE